MCAGLSALSTRAQRRAYTRPMEELFRTNNPVDITFAEALLSAEDIDCFVFDVHMSILDGSIGILPRRVMVATRDAFMARAILRDNEFELSERR